MARTPAVHGLFASVRLVSLDAARERATVSLLIAQQPDITIIPNDLVNVALTKAELEKLHRSIGRALECDS
jgi:hypothetical protein